MWRDAQPLRSTLPPEESDQRFMVVDPAKDLERTLDDDAATDGRFKWAAADEDAPFDAGPKPTRDDLVGHKEASFETDADIVGVRALDEESFKWLESPDDSTEWKIDATVEVPKEEIDEFSGQFQVMDTPEPLDDALWLDDKAGGLWATEDTVLEPLDDPQAFDAGPDGTLDF
jgi:hypothetical protein